MPPFHKMNVHHPHDSPRTSGESDNSSPSFTRNASTSSSQSSTSLPTIKCILVGDSAIGKTSLISSYSRPEEDQSLAPYIPTTFDNYAVSVTVENKPIKVQLCDTSGQEEFSTLRGLWYADGDVFLICYNVADLKSFYNAIGKWVQEVKKFCSDSPIVLVGLQSDLTSPLGVPSDLVDRAADEIPNCVGFVECSSLGAKEKVKDVFDLAIFAALNHHGFVRRRRGLSSFRCKKYKCKSEMWNLQADSSSPSGSTNNVPFDSSLNLCRKAKPYPLKALFSCFCGQR